MNVAMRHFCFALQRSRLLAGLILAIFAASPSQAEWSTGDEREVDRGIFARLIGQKDGWHVWRFEMNSVDDISCVISKSPGGKANEPNGFGDGITGRKPILTLSRRITNWNPQPKIITSFRGTYPRATDIDWKVENERYWSDSTDFERIQSLDGKRIEVVVVSYLYPNIREQRSVAKGMVDLTGINWALAELARCR